MPWVFTYSDLSPQALTALLNKAPFCSLPASLPNYKISFKGRSRKWGGAIATLERAKSSWVYGSAILLPPDDIRVIDKYYSAYETKDIKLFLDATQDKIKAKTYILDKALPYGMPSDDYTKAMLKHLKFFWGQSGTGKMSLDKFGITVEPPVSKRKTTKVEESPAVAEESQPEEAPKKRRRRRKTLKKK
tara:strand:+ start:400 stop:966 length:567 start_codon:yes stop_codon:yes gene_type:complete